MSQEASTGLQASPDSPQNTGESAHSVGAEQLVAAADAETADIQPLQPGMVERAKNAIGVGVANAFGEGLGKVNTKLENLKRRGGVAAIGASVVAFGVVMATTRLPGVSQAVGLGEHMIDSSLDALQSVDLNIDHDVSIGSGPEEAIQLDDAELASSSSPLGEQASEGSKDSGRSATAVFENDPDKKSDDVKLKVQVPAGFEVEYDEENKVFEVTTNTGEKVMLPEDAFNPTTGRLDLDQSVKFKAAHGLSLDQEHSGKKHTIELRDGFKETDRQEAVLRPINEALERKYEGVSVTVDQRGYHVHVQVEGHKYPTTIDLKGLKLHLDPEGGKNLEWLQQQLAGPLAERGLELTSLEDGKITVVEKGNEWLGGEETALLAKAAVGAAVAGALYKGVPIIRRRLTKSDPYRTAQRAAWEARKRDKLRREQLKLEYIRDPSVSTVDKHEAPAIERLKNDFLAELQGRLLIRMPEGIRANKNILIADKAAYLSSKQIEKAFISLTKEWEKVHKGIQPIRVQAGMFEALTELGVNVPTVYKLNRKGIITGVKSTNRVAWADNLRSNLK